MPSGTPTLSPLNWTSTSPVLRDLDGRRWMRAAQVCAPPVARVRCAMFDGAHPCPPNTTASYWYTGASDGRTCSSCACGTPTGASCSGLALSVGSDYSCSTVTQTVGPGQRKCYRGRRREFARAGLQWRADHADVRGLVDGVRHDHADRHEDRLLPVLGRVGEPRRGFPARAQMWTTSPSAAAVASYMTSDSVGWGWTAASTSCAVASDVIASDISAIRSVTP